MTTSLKCGALSDTGAELRNNAGRCPLSIIVEPWYGAFMPQPRAVVPILTFTFLLALLGCGPKLRVVQPGEKSGGSTSYAPLSTYMLRTPQTEAAGKAAGEARLRQTPGYGGGDDNSNLKPLREIVVTSGPINQPHRILGRVAVDTTKIVRVHMGRAIAGAITGTRTTKLPSTPDASLSEIFQRLGTRARQTYGSAADAVINATYQVEPDGDVFAEGIAVEFLPETNQGPPAANVATSIEDRLQILKVLHGKGLIGDDEFSQKKADILDGL